MNSDKCIIFDMDGVLIDSEPLHFKFEQEIFNSLGIVVPPKLHESFVGTNSRTLWSIIKKTFNVPDTVSDLMESENSGFLKFLRKRESIGPIQGVSEFLERLRYSGFSIILASSSPHEQIDFILDKCNISEYFSVRISGDDVLNGKPDPEIFLLAAKTANFEPENCIVIEDSKNGVNAAVQAGMKCIGYRNPGSGNQDLAAANLIIDDFNSLTISLIEELFCSFKKYDL